MTVSDDTLETRVQSVFQLYREARRRVGALLDSQGESLDAVTSMAEEFGAAHTVDLLRTAPKSLRHEAQAIAIEGVALRLKLELDGFLDANDTLDRAVCSLELARPKTNPDEWLIAFHGELALLNTKTNTVRFLERPSERMPLEIS